MYFIYCVILAGTMLQVDGISYLDFSDCIDVCIMKCQSGDVGGITEKLSIPPHAHASDCILKCPSSCQHHLNRLRNAPDRLNNHWNTSRNIRSSRPSYFCKGTGFNVFHSCVSNCDQDRCFCQERNHNGDTTGMRYYCNNKRQNGFI